MSHWSASSSPSYSMLLIWLPANAFQEQQNMALVLGLLSFRWDSMRELLVLPWPIPGCYGHLAGSESVNRRSASLSSPSLSVWLFQVDENKY